MKAGAGLLAALALLLAVGAQARVQVSEQGLFTAIAGPCRLRTCSWNAPARRAAPRGPNCCAANRRRRLRRRRLQWSVKGDYVNFPFGSDSPPLVLRTMEGDAPDRIVMVSNSTAEGWELAAFEADTGAPHIPECACCAHTLLWQEHVLHC